MIQQSLLWGDSLENIVEAARPLMESGFIIEQMLSHDGKLVLLLTRAEVEDDSAYSQAASDGAYSQAASDGAYSQAAQGEKAMAMKG